MRQGIPLTSWCNETLSRNLMVHSLEKGLITQEGSGKVKTGLERRTEEFGVCQGRL